MIELSVECRRLIESEKFQRWFPYVVIESDQNTKKKIDLQGGARRQITSVGSKTTGKGGTHLIGDDLHDAHDSKNAFRDNAHWFFATFMATRGDPTGFCVVLGCQMLDPEDAANQIVQKQLKFWTWLCLPLYYDPARPCVTIPLPFIEEWVAEHGEDTPWFDAREPGEGLWDEVYGKERVEQIQASLSDREFDAQFQQLARKREGGVWKEDWLEEFRILEFEKVKRFVTSTDSPFKSKQRSKTGDPDYYAQAIYAEVERTIETGDPEKPIKKIVDYYVLGCVNKQIGYPDMKKEFRSFVDYWDAILGGAIALHLIEDKANGSAIIEDLSPEYPLIEEYDPGKISKELRFELVAPTVKAHRLFFPSEDGAKLLMGGKILHTLDLEFLPKMKKQFTTIPNTDDGHDDMADTFAQLDLHNRYGDTEPDEAGDLIEFDTNVYEVTPPGGLWA